MPGLREQQVLQPLGLPAAPALAPTIKQLMAFLVQRQLQMAEMMKTFSADKSSGKEHLANARLDERNFRRIKDFSNKREDWKESKMHFTSSVRECDTSFADYLWTIEKNQGAAGNVEIDLVGLSPV